MLIAITTIFMGHLGNQHTQTGKIKINWIEWFSKVHNAKWIVG